MRTDENNEIVRNCIYWYNTIYCDLLLFTECLKAQYGIKECIVKLYRFEGIGISL